MTTILFTKTCARDLPLAEHQMRLAKKFWRNAPLHVYVVDEVSELPNFPRDPRGYNAEVRYLMGRSPGHDERWVKIEGYLRQQAVKLLAPELVRSDVFCTATFQIDADCMPSAPFDWANFEPLWLYYDKPVWPVEHIRKQIPAWNRTARDMQIDTLDATIDNFTFMAGLGWWVPNEVSGYLVETICNRFGVSDPYEAFQQIQRRHLPFSEYQWIGRVMLDAPRLLGRTYTMVDHNRVSLEDPYLRRVRPAFDHLPMEQGGSGWVFPDMRKLRVDELLAMEAP